MKKRIIFRRPDIGMFLVLVAGLFLASNALAKPVIVTLVNINNCKASYDNNNCGGKGNPGDICIAEGPNTIVDLKYVLVGGNPKARFTEMKIERVPNEKKCPKWIDNDFPDFDPASCTYKHPDKAPAKVLQVSNLNHHEATWNYSITVDLADPNCNGPVVVDPLIENGGGNY